MAEGQQWSGKSRGGTFGVLFFVKLITILGPRAAYVFLWFVIPYYLLFAPKAFRASYFYHHKILHQRALRSFGAVFFHYYKFGQILVDRIAIKHGLSKLYAFSRDADAEKELMRIIDEGRGAILLGAHIGAWEIGTMMSDRYARKINVVMMDAEYRGVKRAVEAGVADIPYNIIPISDDGLESMMLIKQAIDRGEVVSFQGDRYLAGHATIEAELMGKSVHLPAGVFKIAARLHVPVVFYCTMRESGRHYHFSFKVIDNENVKPRELVNNYCKYIDEQLQKYPDQWFNFYDFWKQ